MDENEILEPETESAGDTPAASETPAAPVEVISVEELIERLTTNGEEAEEEETPAAVEEQEEESGEEEPSISEQYFMQALDDSTSDEILHTVVEIREIINHPAMTTEFADYTVTESLLLLLFLSVFGSWLVKIVKGGFSWLL